MDSLSFSATSSGQRWTYSFSLTTTSTADEVTVYFDSALYRNLQFVASPAGWNTLLIQPDTAIPAAGYFDAIFPQLSAPAAFSVSFEYLGSGAPSSQRFEMLDSRTLSVLSSGQTEAAGVVPTVSYTVPGTQATDFIVPGGGNNHLGGGGSDVYIIGSATLNAAITASLTDTEGSNIIQLVDGTILSASQFLADALQLTLSTGAKVQVLGASKFSYQVGANAVAGDTAASLSYAQFAAALGTTVPTSGSTAGTAGFVVPTTFTAAPTITPAMAGTPFTVPGTLGPDFAVVSGGDSYRGGGGNDTYLVGKHTLVGAVTASIVDTEGSNLIQLIDGTVFATSTFLNDAVELTLSTGAKVQILGASKFGYQVGANVISGDVAVTSSYAQLAGLFGTSVPAAGASANSGMPNYTVPTQVGAQSAAVADLIGFHIDEDVGMPI